MATCGPFSDYGIFERERVRMAQRQNDTVVKSTRCVTLARRVTLAQRHKDTVCLFGTVTKRHGASL